MWTKINTVNYIQYTYCTLLYIVSWSKEELGKDELGRKFIQILSYEITSFILKSCDT